MIAAEQATLMLQKSFRRLSEELEAKNQEGIRRTAFEAWQCMELRKLIFGDERFIPVSIVLPEGQP